MIGLGAGALKIFVALEAQDLRKSFQGLSELAQGAARSRCAASSADSEEGSPSSAACLRV